ncbi:MAG: DUF4197 domain-containing protein [Pseudomonadota bacterium]
MAEQDKNSVGQIIEAGSTLSRRQMIVLGGAVGATCLLPINGANAGIFDKLKKMLGSDEAAALTEGDVVKGLKEALKVGTDRVVSQLGTAGGFLNDDLIRIPLPATLQKVDTTLSRFGAGGLMDNLKTRMNAAAEAATPKARALFVGAVQEMTVEDAFGILNGGDTAATQYFREKTSEALGGEMRPIVSSALSDVGALKALDQITERYDQVPFAPKIDTDLTGHVVGKAMDGIFYYVAEEEKKIRANPLQQSSEILKKVFGNKSS